MIRKLFLFQAAVGAMSAATSLLTGEVGEWAEVSRLCLALNFGIVLLQWKGPTQ